MILCIFRIRLKKKRDREDVLVAENCVLRAEVSRCRAKVEAMADEFHAAKRRLLDETKWRQVGHAVLCFIALRLLNSHSCTPFALFAPVPEIAREGKNGREGGQLGNFAEQSEQWPADGLEPGVNDSVIEVSDTLLWCLFFCHSCLGF